MDGLVLILFVVYVLSIPTPLIMLLMELRNDLRQRSYTVRELSQNMFTLILATLMPILNTILTIKIIGTSNPAKKILDYEIGGKYKESE